MKEIKTPKEKIFPKKFIASVIFPMKGKEVCLAVKTRGIGKGKRNGYGGGQDEGEDILECTIRELREESGVEASRSSFTKVGFIKINNIDIDGELRFTCYLHVLVLNSWTGEFKETPEMLDPQWFQISNLPTEDMMQADLVWLPRILGGEKLKGEITCDPEQNLIGEAALEALSVEEGSL